MFFFPESPVAEQELGASSKVVTKSGLEPWRGSSKGCRSVAEAEAWGQYPDSRILALGSWQQVWMTNRQLNVMEQIDHCITDHNLLISAKRAIHYLACHTAHVITRGKSPRPQSVSLITSHLFSMGEQGWMPRQSAGGSGLLRHLS